MSSFPLTFIFFRGVAQPPTSPMSDIIIHSCESLPVVVWLSTSRLVCSFAEAKPGTRQYITVSGLAVVVQRSQVL